MRVDINGVSYDIRFSYRTYVLIRHYNEISRKIYSEGKKDIGRKGLVTETTCTISTIDFNKPKGPHRYHEIGRGVAMQHGNDDFDKDTGRKLAFSKVLRHIGADKEQRTIFWDEYLASTKPTNQKVLA